MAAFAVPSARSACFQLSVRHEHVKYRTSYTQTVPNYHQFRTRLDDDVFSYKEMVVVATVSAAAAVAHTTPPSVSIVVPIPFWHLSPLVHVPQMSSRTRAQFHCGTTTAAAVWADTTKTIHNIFIFVFFFC